MPIITDRVTVEVQVEPFELGRIFAKMHSGEQAEFFAGVAQAVSEWEKPDGFQWSYLEADLMREHPDGLRVFRSMAEYATPSTVE